MSYPPPDQNPKCQCYPNMLAAFFCPFGHMTECHYPLTCSEAECSHLARYIDAAAGDDVPDADVPDTHMPDADQ